MTHRMRDVERRLTGGENQRPVGPGGAPLVLLELADHLGDSPCLFAGRPFLAKRFTLPAGATLTVDSEVGRCGR